MDPLCDPLKTRPIQTGWEFTMEPYPSGQFGFIDDPDGQFGNGSVWTRTWTRSDGPEPLLTLVAALKTNWVEIVREAVAGPCLVYKPITASKTLIIDVCDHLPPRSPKIQDQESLSLCWHSFSRWDRESVAFSFAYKGGHYNDYR